MRLNYLLPCFFLFLSSCHYYARQFAYIWNDHPFIEQNISPAKEEMITKKFNLPPDPGEEGEKTLLGIDSDNDGLRDDVQRWIYLTFPDQLLIRKAFIQTAQDQLKLYGTFNDIRKLKNSVDRYLDSIICKNHIYAEFNNDKDPFFRQTLHQLIENTYERYIHMSEAVGYSSRKKSELEKESHKLFSTCRFQVDTKKQDFN